MERPDRITVKVLPSHYEALRRLAEEEEEGVSTIVRRLIKEEARRRGVWPVERGAMPCRN